MSEVGYHGTNRRAAGLILREGFKKSSNRYDWLGTGTYFFQDAPVRAWEWAREHHPGDPAVLRSAIDLRDCMDLLDQPWKAALADSYGAFRAFVERNEIELPRQAGGAHRLDAAVIDYFVAQLERQGEVVRSVRGAFAEGGPLFEGSALRTHDHVQIAVRDTDVIREVVIDSIK